MFNQLSSALNQATNHVVEGATQTARSAEISMYRTQISDIKARWGRESFDRYVANDQQAVAALAQRAQQEITALQQKIANVEAKMQPATGTQRQQVTVTVPAGVSPGQQFQVSAGGPPFGVIVPPGMAPGSQLVVTVPPGHAAPVATAALPVVAGKPVPQ
mmetsp:Transcript_6850/g.16097  ORF Transcript_6850/g.16097 Transcript_6850/m.16097 type:complete len:160 (-) Transcript_6850:161-640(-)